MTSMDGTPQLRAPNVRELKEMRVIYLTGFMEALTAEVNRAVNHQKVLGKEKERLVAQLGYDPTKGTVPARPKAPEATT